MIQKEYRKMKLSELIPYENNPRNNEAAVIAVAESIQATAYISPIVIDENRVILAGHTRLKALQAQGVTEEMVLQVTGLTEPQKTRFRLMDNRAGEFSEWDMQKLQEELDRMDLSDLERYFDDLIQENAGDGEDPEPPQSTLKDREVTCPRCGARFQP